jgi:hypothetical protein
VLGSRRFQLGFDRVNLHHPTMAKKLLLVGWSSAGRALLSHSACSCMMAFSACSNASSCRPICRGLHSFTFQLNLNALLWDRGLRVGVV